MSSTEITNYESGGYSNPFKDAGAIVKAGRGSVADTQVATKELGEIQARVFLAKQFGRDQGTAYDKIMTACQRVGLASVAIYTYSRGGTNVNGPSIRLAEEIARDWGNIDCGWTELERNDRESTVKAYAWDLETNAYKQITFMVPLQRTKRSGSGRITVPITDERDIYELLANNAARRMRNCVLAIIPGDIVEDAVSQCHKTLVTKCEITPDRIKKMLAAFEPFGVTKQQIETRIQRKIEAIAPAQFVKLMEIFNSLKDGMSEPSDWFEVVTEEAESAPSAADALKETLKSSRAPKAAKKAEPPKPEPPKVPEEKQPSQPEPPVEDELPFESAEPAPGKEPTLYERLAAKVKETKTRAGFQSVYDTVNRGVSSGELTQQQGDALLKMIDDQAAS